MKIEDERIKGEKRIISARILGYVYMALWLIVLYRQFILKQELVQYLDIFLLTVATSAALVFSNMKKGLYLSYRSVKQQHINIIIGTIVGGTLAFSINHFMNEEKLMSSILTAGVFMLLFGSAQLVILHYSNKKSNENTEND